MINEMDVKDLINIIDNNPNIDISIKDKIMECVELIVRKYPVAYKNLYINLETITIRYSKESDIDILKEVGADSCYVCKENLIILNEEKVNSEYYKNLLVHELLHVSSYNDVNMGFESLEANRGVSFNEGMTEYLTGEVLDNHSFGMATYQNDINNIMLLSTIIPLKKLEVLYFKEGLLGILNEYLNKINSKENLLTIIINMDNEHISRARNGESDNNAKDNYIKLLIEDISKIDFLSDEEIIRTIRTINNFIRIQYNTDTIPPTIKESVSNSINDIFKKFSFNNGEQK